MFERMKHLFRDVGDEAPVEVIVDSEREVMETPPEALYSDEEVEVFVDDENSPDVSETQRLYEDLKKRSEALESQVDPVKALRESVLALGSTLTPKPAAPDVTVKPSTNGVDWKAYREKFNTAVYEDPFSQTLDLVMKVTEALNAQNTNTALALSKKITEANPATAAQYRRWANEVEEEVAKMPPQLRASNPNVYEDALRIVQSRHFEELVQEKAAELVKGKMAAPGKGAYSESGGASQPAMVKPKSKQQIRLSLDEKRDIENAANDRGVSFDVMLRYYQRNGLLRR